MSKLCKASAIILASAMFAVGGVAEARAISVRSGAYGAGQDIGSFSEGAHPGVPLISGTNPAVRGSVPSASAMPFPGDPLALGPENIFAVAWSGNTPKSFEEMLMRVKHRLGLAKRQAASAAVVGSTSTASQNDVGLMLLVGVGLIGYQLRRKQKALQPHPFAA